MTIDLTDMKRLLATFSLPSRLRHALDYAGCLTLADALQLTPDRLHRLPKAGVATLQAFLDFLDIGLTLDDLKQTRKMHLTFGEILGLATDDAAMVDLATLKLRRISDEEIAREAGKYVTTHPQSSAYEAFRMGARIARQWQARLLAVTKNITPVMVRAACGHEYKTGILHTDEDDFREQRAILATLPCLACVEETQTIHGQVVSFTRKMESEESKNAVNDPSSSAPEM